jgi:hypothetical protein
MRQQFITKYNEQVDTATANYTSTNDKVLDAVVDANRRAVDFAVKTVDAITNAVEVPDLPAMPKMPVELPFADRFELPELPEFPTPAETGKRYISFVERAADLNRDLSERVIDMLKVEADKPVVKTAAKPAAKTAAKPAAKKPAAKKPVAKKPVAKKPVAKKPVAKKPVAKKPAVRTAAPKSTAEQAPVSEAAATA